MQRKSISTKGTLQREFEAEKTMHPHPRPKPSLYDHYRGYMFNSNPAPNTRGTLARELRAQQPQVSGLFSQTLSASDLDKLCLDSAQKKLKARHKPKAILGFLQREFEADKTNHPQPSLEPVEPQSNPDAEFFSLRATCLERLQENISLLTANFRGTAASCAQGFAAAMSELVSELTKDCWDLQLIEQNLKKASAWNAELSYLVSSIPDLKLRNSINKDWSQLVAQINSMVDFVESEDKTENTYSP